MPKLLVAFEVLFDPDVEENENIVAFARNKLHEAGRNLVEMHGITSVEFNAATFVPDLKEDEFDGKCPVCGSPNGEHLEDTTYECHDCGNTYEVVKEKP